MRGFTARAWAGLVVASISATGCAGTSGFSQRPGAKQQASTRGNNQSWSENNPQPAVAKTTTSTPPSTKTPGLLPPANLAKAPIQQLSSPVVVPPKPQSNGGPNGQTLPVNYSSPPMPVPAGPYASNPQPTAVSAPETSTRTSMPTPMGLSNEPSGAYPPLPAPVPPNMDVPAPPPPIPSMSQIPAPMPMPSGVTVPPVAVTVPPPPVKARPKSE